MARLDAPWTQEQVDAINRYQRGEAEIVFHEFTCKEHSDVPLHACSSELYCPTPNCSYRQEWVHDWMAGVKR